MELFFPAACHRVAHIAATRAPRVPRWQVIVYTDMVLVALLMSVVLETGLAALEAVAHASGRAPPWHHAGVFWTLLLLTSLVAAQVRGFPDDLDGGPRQLSGA